VFERTKARAAIFGRHLGQSTAACLTAMTKGDLTAVTLQHWETALATGIAVGLFGILMMGYPYKCGDLVTPRI
jgi:hypothetical protein